MKTLYLITARGGSKGLPGKNIMQLNGKSLISYSIDFARKFVSDNQICVSTDDKSIINTVQNEGLKVPFVRPEHLATDRAGSYGVIKHALEYYREKSIEFENLVLLQPTSPIRRGEDLLKMMSLYSSSIDAVVSVKESKDNPLFNLYTESESGELIKYYEKDVQHRQSQDQFYYLNGSIYILNVNSIFKNDSIPEMPKKIKYVMDTYHSIDIDSVEDFEWCKYVLRHKLHIQ